MKTVRLLPILVLLGAAACTDVTQPQMDEEVLFSRNGATKTAMSFDVGVLEWVEFERMWFPDGRVHADGTLLGPVSGDLEGSANLFLRVRLDDKSWAEDEKVGIANGTLTLTTAVGVWGGPLTGTFIGEQLFSRVVLHGPLGLKFEGHCDETTPVSEVLACSGEVLSPHG